MWRAHVPAYINMNIIKSPFLHQKSFIKSSSNLQEAYHLGFTCQLMSLLGRLYGDICSVCNGIRIQARLHPTTLMNQSVSHRVD